MKQRFTAFLFVFILILSASGAVFAQQTEREKGIELYRQGNYAQAINVLEAVSKRKETKTDAEVWNYLGLSYVENKDLKKGRKALEKAVKLSPQRADFRTSLGYAYLLSRKIDSAQSEISKAITLDPKNVGAYYIRGTANLWEGKPDEALADADRIISIDWNYPSAYALKSDVYVALFGKKIGEGEIAGTETGYLLQAIQTLEYCLKNCKDNPNPAPLSSRLESVNAFYKYFNRVRTDSDFKASTSSGEDLAENIVKTPLKVIKRPLPRYTNNARQSNINGTVKLGVLFAASGKVSHVIVLNRLGHGLDEQAVYAARQITFEPATENGKPVSVVKTVMYTFTIY